MRIVFVGAEDTAVRTTALLKEKGHEIIIIDSDRKKIDTLADRMDCSFLHGDGSSPAILREVSPEQSDVLIAVSNSDTTNLIASLVAGSLGFKRVISRIQNPEYENICRELKLEDTIMPPRNMSLYLSDMVSGIDSLELSRVIKDTARFFVFIAGEDDTGHISDLELPESARVVSFYREDRFHLANEKSRIQKDDEVIVLTDDGTIKDLGDRWTPEKRYRVS